MGSLWVGAKGRIKRGQAARRTPTFMLDAEAMADPPLLPPEAVDALWLHLRAAGREVALGLEQVVGLVRTTLARREGGADPAMAALDETLRRVEQALAFVVLVAPPPADPAAAARTRVQVLESVLSVVEAALDRADELEPAAAQARRAALGEVADALEREIDSAKASGMPPTPDA